MKPTLLHHVYRGRADKARGTPWQHAPQTEADIELCGESDASRAYWEGYGGRPAPADLEPAAAVG